MKSHKLHSSLQEVYCWQEFLLVGSTKLNLYWLTQKRQDQVLYKAQVCQDVQSSSYFIQSNQFDNKMLHLTNKVSLISASPLMFV